MGSTAYRALVVKTREIMMLETFMRLLFLPTAAAVLGAAILALPAQAASPRHYPPYAPRAYSTRPYWQGEPTDRFPIWRYGYYQGNDPDSFIRLQLMRDPPIPER